MSTQSEKKIELEVVKYAKSKNILSFKMNSTSSRGLPDRIFINKNSIFFIEFKRFGFKPTELQAHTIKTLKDYNCNVFVVDNIELGKKIIDKYNDRYN